MENEKVLIIDDDPGFRKTLSDILRVKGYASHVAGDGEEGLSLLSRGDFQVLLLDLALPGMSGVEVLGRVKAGWPHTETIILTGNASLDSAIEAVNRGAFSYLRKPYEIDQLMIQIRRALEKRLAEEQIMRHNDELQRKNEELKTLYEISVAIGRTIDPKELFSEILNVMTGRAAFGVRRKGLVFTSEADHLQIASSIGLSETELLPCKRLRTGECLCGLAALTGEIVVSPDSLNDDRHTIRYPGGQTSHGHLVVPLKAANGIVDVLCLYLEAGTDPTADLLKSLVAISNQIGIAMENARIYEQARTFSYYDPLTGLANRRLLQIQLENMIYGAKRYGTPLSAVMIDIDHFKLYNDANGHIEGDRLLVEVADILRNGVRCADYVFRYGGEEFLILLPNTDLEATRSVAEGLRETVKTGTGITTSLGVASYSQSNTDWAQLIMEGDDAMYRAKESGRDRVELSL